MQTQVMPTPKEDDLDAQISDLLDKAAPACAPEDEARAKAVAVEQARQSLASGRQVSHEAVMRWLDSWGTPNELPPPKCD